MARNIDDDHESLKRDGYVILDRLLSETHCDEIVAAFDRIEHEYDIRPLEMDFAGRNTTRIFNLLQYDNMFMDIPLIPDVLDLLSLSSLEVEHPPRLVHLLGEILEVSCGVWTGRG